MRINACTALSPDINLGEAAPARGAPDQLAFSFGVSTALRFAMKAARRAPRAHGMTVSFLAAVSSTLLMKRVLVFMALVLC